MFLRVLSRDVRLPFFPFDSIRLAFEIEISISIVKLICGDTSARKQILGTDTGLSVASIVFSGLNN